MGIAWPCEYASVITVIAENPDYLGSFFDRSSSMFHMNHRRADFTVMERVEASTGRSGSCRIFLNRIVAPQLFQIYRTELTLLPLFAHSVDLSEGVQLPSKGSSQAIVPKESASLSVHHLDLPLGMQPSFHQYRHFW